MGKEFSEALSTNRFKLVYVDFGNNTVEQNTMRAIIKMISSSDHLIKFINLESLQIHSRALLAFSAGLTQNLGMSLGIEELILDGNPFDVHSQKYFAKWLSSMRSYSHLRRLSLRNCSLDIGTIVQSLLDIPLENLNLTGNKFHEDTFSNLHYFLSSTPLKYLSLSQCGIPHTQLSNLLAFCLNSPSPPFHLDISFNPTQNTIIPLPTQSKTSGKFLSLNLSGLALRPHLSVTFVQSLAPHVKKLILDQNFEKGGLRLSSVLGKILSSGEIESLSLRGSADSYMEDKLLPLFESLKKNDKLVELDISNQQCGDASFIVLCQSLRKNMTLKTLRAIGNNISFNGLIALEMMLDINKTLKTIEVLENEHFKSSEIPDTFIQNLNYQIISRRQPKVEPPNQFSYGNIDLLPVPQQLQDTIDIPALDLDEVLLQTSRSRALSRSETPSNDTPAKPTTTAPPQVERKQRTRTREHAQKRLSQPGAPPPPKPEEREKHASQLILPTSKSTRAPQTVAPRPANDGPKTAREHKASEGRSRRRVSKDIKANLNLSPRGNTKKQE
uniref:Uncharacterized protein n=1 Tax=Arcella intermedia TaxID=1963864 RepID=A0A6B2L0K5_9EUKA